MLGSVATVLQGSILSPVLFNIYRPLGGITGSLGLSFINIIFSVMLMLSWCLAAVLGWMRASEQKLNSDKTETLLGSSCV